MSRPKPSVILDYTSKSYKAEQVLYADAIYAVFYDGKPINLRTIENILKDKPGPKYKKASFSNPGHAFNLKEKLNKLFKTDKFDVFKLTSGEKIQENEKD